MEDRETTYTETLSIVGNYIMRERTGLSDVPIIVSVVAFTVLAGLAALSRWLLVSTVNSIRGIIILCRWVDKEIVEPNRKAKRPSPKSADA